MAQGEKIYWWRESRQLKRDITIYPELLTPEMRQMRSTVRLYAGECQWCALNAMDPEDLSAFRRIIRKQTGGTPD
jgi:hypothetical protein